MTIGISPHDSKLLRALFILGMIVGFIFLLASIMAFIMTSRLSGGMSTPAASWQIYAGALIYVPAFIVLALEIAASRIAPPSENHALRKRLIGLYFLLAAMLLASIGDHGEVFYGLSLFLLIPVVVDALSEPTVTIKSIYRPYLNRGPFWRMAGEIFTPGWITAPNYVVLLAALCTVGLFADGQFKDPATVLDYVSFLGWLIFPAALIRLVAPSTRYFLGFYIALQLFFAALAMLVSMMSGITNEPLGIWLSPIPNCVHFFAAFKQIRSEQLPEFLTITFVTTGIALSLLIARALASRRDIRAALNQS